MNVLKFGGTSVGTVESLRNVKQIVESRDERLIVVVSALGGLTDKLIATAEMAAKGDNSYRESVDAITDRHYNIIARLVPEHWQPQVYVQVDELLAQLRDLYRSINFVRNMAPSVLDQVVSFGERLSSTIIARIIDEAVLVDSRMLFKTREMFGRHVLASDETHRLLMRHLAPMSHKVIIVPGFISTDVDGRITNLGRGGSDYTASVIAAELEADTLEIWTDVDGFMTADPRIIDDARVIPALGFKEAMELCNFGAKVVYPPTIYPVFHSDIPILIKNTFNPSAPGTLIANSVDSASATVPSGISSLPATALIALTSHSGASGMEVGSRVFNALAAKGISLYLLSDHCHPNTTLLNVRESDVDSAAQALTEEFAQEIADGTLSRPIASKELATIAVVGHSLREHGAEVASQVDQALAQAGIASLASASSPESLTLAIVVNRSDLNNAMKAIHRTLFN